MEKGYEITIGLEIHAELKTKTKMFCACQNDPDETRPNVNICPVCMAHPGTLPVANKKAIEYVIKVGLALDGKIADFSEFDRKNYFYPDIPKGYQISQYKYPIISGGKLNGVDITRVHLEEDTGISIHNKGDYSLIDFNRAGVPLMELVTEPVIHSAEEARNFARELQILLRYLDVSEANMEKGEMRVEANISVSKEKNLGTKVEVKNLNSFKSVERAINYEAERMINLLENEKGNEIIQETRGWDENKQKTFSQRSKESSHDYRYFPEPDLPKMYLHKAFDIKKMEKELPEMPWEKRERYQKDFEIKDEDIEIFINDPNLAKWFEDVIKELGGKKELIKIASNYITNDMIGFSETVMVAGTTKYPTPKNFAKLIFMNFDKKINSAVTKKLLGNLVTFDEDPEKLAREDGLLQESDEGKLKEIIEEIIKNNPKVVEDYKKGKETPLQFLVGQVMKETKGSANPQIVSELLKNFLNKKAPRD